MRWADVVEIFDESENKQGVAKFYKSKSIFGDFPYNNKDELPDVFVYLCEGSSSLCFIRLKVQNLEETPKLYYFSPDQSLESAKKIQKNDAGIVKMGFKINSCQISGQKELKLVNKNFSESKLVSGILISNIFLAQELIPADSDGNSDPFYIISFYGQSIKGDVVKKSLNPVIINFMNLHIFQIYIVKFTHYLSYYILRYGTNNILWKQCCSQRMNTLQLS